MTRGAAPLLFFLCTVCEKRLLKMNETFKRNIDTRELLGPSLSKVSTKLDKNWYSQTTFLRVGREILGFFEQSKSLGKKRKWSQKPLTRLSKLFFTFRKEYLRDDISKIYIKLELFIDFEWKTFRL